METKLTSLKEKCKEFQSAGELGAYVSSESLRILDESGDDTLVDVLNYWDIEENGNWEKRFWKEGKAKFPSRGWFGIANDFYEKFKRN
jgi:hypothetical protein